MNAQQLMNAEIEAANKIINPFNFYLDGGNVYSDKHKDTLWAKPVILKDNVQIGRITYKFTGFGTKVGIHPWVLWSDYTMERYYVKQYKPQDYPYDENDDVFYLLDYYFRTGLTLTNLHTIVQNTIQYCELDLAIKENWRELNPLPEKYRTNGKRHRVHRKKLTGRNPRHVISEMVSKL